VVALGVVGVRRGGHPTLEQQTMSLAAQVRCPVCEGQSAAQSDAPPSIQIRNLIRQDLSAGKSSGEILDALVADYGPGILERPPAHGVDLLVWVLPIAAVAMAVAGLALAFARWRPKGTSMPDSEDQELVRSSLVEPDPESTAPRSPESSGGR
jgi:cytochrome c-type biogenesis protein CcmH